MLAQPPGAYGFDLVERLADSEEKREACLRVVREATLMRRLYPPTGSAAEAARAELRRRGYPSLEIRIAASAFHPDAAVRRQGRLHATRYRHRNEHAGDPSRSGSRVEMQ